MPMLSLPTLFDADVRYAAASTDPTRVSKNSQALMSCIFESLYISISFMTIICKENDIDGKSKSGKYNWQHEQE